MLSALNIDRLALLVFMVAISDIINIPEFKEVSLSENKKPKCIRRHLAVVFLIFVAQNHLDWQ